jgi:hypothetical protein
VTHQLQVNTAGAWRNVVRFEAAMRPKVIEAVAVLSSAVPDATWCIVHPDGKREWITSALSTVFRDRSRR